MSSVVIEEVRLSSQLEMVWYNLKNNIELARPIESDVLNLNMNQLQKVALCFAIRHFVGQIVLIAKKYI